jgi:AcrR family transcriptional regulator
MQPIPASENGRAFDRRFGEILEHAARLFSYKGYAAASIRDLSRQTGISLAGLYHYFDSKESLLYSLQRHTFATVIDSARRRSLAPGLTHEQRIHAFIRNHLEFFLSKPDEMKVLSHEDDTLVRAEQSDGGSSRSPRGTTGERPPAKTHQEEIAGLKREYYKLCLQLIEDLSRHKRLSVPPRIAVLSLFGMLNWTYTWHRATRDPGAPELAESMADLFLFGLVERAGIRPQGKMPGMRSTNARRRQQTKRAANQRKTTSHGNRNSQ